MSEKKAEILRAVKSRLATIADEALEVGYTLLAFAAIADERGTSLCITRSPGGAWVIQHGEPATYLGEDIDLRRALEKSYAVFEPWLHQ